MKYGEEAFVTASLRGGTPPLLCRRFLLNISTYVQNLKLSKKKYSYFLQTNFYDKVHLWIRSDIYLLRNVSYGILQKHIIESCPSQIAVERSDWLTKYSLWPNLHNFRFFDHWNYILPAYCISRHANRLRGRSPYLTIGKSSPIGWNSSLAGTYSM